MLWIQQLQLGTKNLSRVYHVIGVTRLPIMLEDPHVLSGGIDCPDPRSCVVKEIKVAVFGKRGVGKTATIAKICGKGMFIAEKNR